MCRPPSTVRRRTHGLGRSLFACGAPHVNGATCEQAHGGYHSSPPTAHLYACALAWEVPRRSAKLSTGRRCAGVLRRLGMHRLPRLSVLHGHLLRSARRRLHLLLRPRLDRCGVRDVHADHALKRGCASSPQRGRHTAGHGLAWRLACVRTACPGTPAAVAQHTSCMHACMRCTPLPVAVGCNSACAGEHGMHGTTHG